MSYQGYQPPFQGQQPPMPPPPPQPYYAQPPPPSLPAYGHPTATVDQFRLDYAHRLSSLTFNSRPIIQELSIMAMQERDRHDWAKMNAVVQEIEAAVQRAGPQAKLPLLYLVDSISKNVGAPYTTQLLPYVIPRMFLTAYRDVDGVTRAKMEEMVALWRTSGPDGGDLYGREVRDAVERDIFGAMGHSGIRAPFPTRERVLQTIHATLEMKHRESAARPWEPEPRRQIDTLQKILGMISSSQVQPQQLQQIMETLQAMAPPPQPPVSAPPAPMGGAYPPPPSTYYPPYNQSSVPPPIPSAPHPVQAPTSNMPPFPPQLPRDQYGTPLPPTLGSPHLSAPPPPPVQDRRSITPQPGQPMPTAAAPSFIPENVAALIRNLNTAGIQGIGSAPRTPESDNLKLDKPKSSLEKYEDMILSIDMRIEALDMTKMSSLPVSHLSQRCTQCGLRFSDGDGVMQAHLDWHFRRNRKQRESEGRGAHRRWLPRGEEWIQQSIVTVEAGPSTSSEKTSKLTAERIAQLKKKRVKVPSDPEVAARPCPICKEPFKAEWSEEDEEWVWRNAIDINEKRTSGDPQIYHAVCRAEQMSARVANRLLKDGDGRRTNSKSPRLTPGLDVPSKLGIEVKLEDGISSTPSSIGKRKAEEDELEVKRVKVEPQTEPHEEQTVISEATAADSINGSMAVDQVDDPIVDATAANSTMTTDMTTTQTNTLPEATTSLPLDQGMPEPTDLDTTGPGEIETAVVSETTVEETPKIVESAEPVDEKE